MMYEGLYATELLTDAAADAERFVHLCLAVFHGDGRTSDPHAGLTAHALCLIHRERRLVFHILE